MWLSSNVVPPKENVTVYVEGAWPASGQDSVAIYVCRDRPTDNSKFFAVKCVFGGGGCRDVPSARVCLDGWLVVVW